jgi:hypothetical protein
MKKVLRKRLRKRFDGGKRTVVSLREANLSLRSRS